MFMYRYTYSLYRMLNHNIKRNDAPNLFLIEIFFHPVLIFFYSKLNFVIVFIEKSEREREREKKNIVFKHFKWKLDLFFLHSFLNISVEEFRQFCSVGFWLCVFHGNFRNKIFIMNYKWIVPHAKQFFEFYMRRYGIYKSWCLV